MMGGLLALQNFHCFRLTAEIAPGFVQLASKQAYAASAQTKFLSRIARPIADAEKFSNFSDARCECFEPSSEVDTHGGCVRRACVAVLNQNFGPRFCLEIVAIQAFDNDVLSSLTIVAGNIVNVETVANPSPIANLSNSERCQHTGAGHTGPPLFDEAGIGLAGIANSFLNRLLVSVTI